MSTTCPRIPLGRGQASEVETTSDADYLGGVCANWKGRRSANETPDSRPPRRRRDRCSKIGQLIVMGRRLLRHVAQSPLWKEGRANSRVQADVSQVGPNPLDVAQVRSARGRLWPKFGRMRPKSDQVAATSSGVGQKWPGIDNVWTDLHRLGAELGQFRPTLSRIKPTSTNSGSTTNPLRPNSVKSGLESPRSVPNSSDVGPRSTSRGPCFVECGQIPPAIDRNWACAPLGHRPGTARAPPGHRTA